MLTLPTRNVIVIQRKQDMKTLFDLVVSAKNIYSEKTKTGLTRLITDSSPQKLGLLSKYTECKDEKNLAEAIVNEKSKLVDSGELKDIFGILKLCAQSLLKPEDGENYSAKLLNMLQQFPLPIMQLFCAEAAIFSQNRILLAKHQIQLKNTEETAEAKLKSTSELLTTQSEQTKNDLLQLQQKHSEELTSKEAKIQSLKDDMEQMNQQIQRLQNDCNVASKLLTSQTEKATNDILALQRKHTEELANKNVKIEALQKEIIATNKKMQLLQKKLDLKTLRIKELHEQKNHLHVKLSDEKEKSEKSKTMKFWS